MKTLLTALLLANLLVLPNLSFAFFTVKAPSFSSSSTASSRHPQKNQPLFLSSSQAQDDASIQWELFHKHHVGSWKGIWTLHDYMGDVQDETVAAVHLLPNDDDNHVIEHTQELAMGAKRSDCATCFDSFETKRLPVASYTKENLGKCRFASCSMVNGPSILRSSGAMATELVLSHGDGRVRVVFQHAPVWERGIEPGSCPPQGLKVVSCLISREAKRESPPTAESEAANPPSEGNPVFYRPVPPFDWHKKWAGTSWTWGPQAGNRGWQLEELEEADSWHGSAPVELWNLRLPAIFVQAPRVITDAETARLRLAWMPDKETLLRVEAGVTALQPMFLEDDELVGFEPPSLVSLRCDSLRKIGDLEGQPMFVRDSSMNEEPALSSSTEATASPAAKVEAAVNKAKAKAPEKKNDERQEKVKATAPKDEPNDDLKAIQEALKL